jgi:hypothetical protein
MTRFGTVEPRVAAGQRAPGAFWRIPQGTSIGNGGPLALLGLVRLQLGVGLEYEDLEPS